EPGDGAQVDDRPAARAPQRRDRVLRAEKDALQIRLEDRFPRLLRAAVDRTVAEAAAADPGTVEDDVEASEPLERCGDGPLHLVRPSHVADVVRLDPIDTEHL